MFSSHIGNEVPASTLISAPELLFTSVTRGRSKRILYVKVVNASSKAQSLDLQISGKDKPTGTAELTTLSGHSTAETNSLADPTRIVPVQTELRGITSDWHHTFPPYSIQVIDVTLQ
jgi:alpha-N-arabinofuranosidase